MCSNAIYRDSSLDGWSIVGTSHNKTQHDTKKPLSQWCPKVYSATSTAWQLPMLLQKDNLQSILLFSQCFDVNSIFSLTENAHTMSVTCKFTTVLFTQYHWYWYMGNKLSRHIKKSIPLKNFGKFFMNYREIWYKILYTAYPFNYPKMSKVSLHYL